MKKRFNHYPEALRPRTHLRFLSCLLSMFVVSVFMLGCSGSDDEVGREKCPTCSGTGGCFSCYSTGICQSCFGQGIVSKGGLDPTTGIVYADKLCDACWGEGYCFTCTGSGLCRECSGTGYISNGNGSWGDDPGGGYNGGGDTPGGGSGSKCKYCLGRKDCRNSFYTPNDKYYCHGSGLCKWCGGDGWQDGMFGTGPNSIPCSACNRPGSGNRGGDGYCGYCGGNGVCHHCGGTGIEP